MIKFKNLCIYALLFSPIVILPAFSSAIFNGLEAVSDEDRKMMVEIAKAVKRVKRNPFLRDDVRESTDSDLREKESANNDDDEAEESHSSSSSSASGVFSGSSNDYCDKFEQHFSFYCVGEVDQSGKNDYVLKKFCPSYKKACAHKTITSSVSLTSWPTDPFEKKITVTSRPVPAVSQGRKPSSSGSSSSSSRRRNSFEEIEDEDSEEFNSKEDEEIYYAELRKRYPCKPDCDHRIFAHCTVECKCDYIYPVVQRFCNPPPLPLFLNTCRLWYHGCPKYERYHYSSQFVYSKAEKGKVLPGSPEQNLGNPYNAAASAPFRRHRALALAPIHRRRNKRDTSNDGEDEEENLELIIPPPVPRPSKLADLKSVLLDNKDEQVVEKKETSSSPSPAPMSRPESLAILENYQKSLENKRRRSRKKKLRRRRHHRQRHNMDEKEYGRRPTTARPPTPVELWRALKKINSITSGPGAVGLTQSPATLKGGRSASPGGLDGFLESIAEENQKINPQSQNGDVARQWAGIDPRQFTKDIVNEATGKENSSEEKTEQESQEPDFSKIKPRTLSPGPTTEVRESLEASSGSEGKSAVPRSVSSGRPKAFQGSIPILPSDASIGAGTGDDTFKAFDGLSDSRGIVHTPRSRSPFTKPGLWEPNPADPHSRDPANKYWYHPESVGVDWLNGQIQWGGHWAVPAAGTGGTAGMSAIHFPTIGSFLNIPDDYD